MSEPPKPDYDYLGKMDLACAGVVLRARWLEAEAERLKAKCDTLDYQYSEVVNKAMPMLEAERDEARAEARRQQEAHTDSINRWNESEARLEAEVESLKAECERVVEDQRYEMVEANAAREMAKRLAEVLSNCLNSLDYIQVNHPPQTGHGVMRDCMTSASAVLAAYREWADE